METINEASITEASKLTLTAEVMAVLQSISEPVGTFGGSEDRIIRIRNGKIVAANTGDQGGGQN
jgi:hypothetical protein